MSSIDELVAQKNELLEELEQTKQDALFNGETNRALVNECDRLREELQQVRKELINANRGAERNIKVAEMAVAKCIDHDSAVRAHWERAEYLAAELEQIRKDLKGHKDSLLSGENGLAQATMRGFEIRTKQLNVTEKALELACEHARKKKAYVSVENGVEYWGDPAYFRKKARDIT